MEYTYIVDRLEGMIAVCEDEDKNMIQIRRDELPFDVKEGDVILEKEGMYFIDADGTSERKNRIRRKMYKIFE